MTNTIPNVPRELTIERDVFGAMHIKIGDFDFIQIQYQHPYTDNAGTKALAERIAALLSAPSPAGVDGLEVVGYVSQDDIKWQGDCTLRLKPYSDYVTPLCRLSDAQATIDGLRGENEALHAQVKVLQSDANSWQSGYDEGRRMGAKHAAPAAPAADAGIVDMYRHLQKVTPYRFKKIQDASITDGGDVMYFHKDRFDAALLADMAAHRAKGVV